jgi:serine protease AprX
LFLRIKAVLFSLVLLFSVFASVVSATNESQTSLEARIDPQLQKVLNTSVELIEVIVTFKGEDAPSVSNLQLLRDAAITNGITFSSLPMVGVLATPDQINQLAKLPEVYSIYDNDKVVFENDTGTEITGVDKVRKDDNFRKLNGGLPVSGKGIGVVINDSGIDGTHPDLEFGDHLVQNVLASINLNAVSGLLPITYQEGVPNTDTTGGHGTHVAGIVGASGKMSTGKYEGVAPGASLIGYGSGAGIAILDTLGGFDYALTHQHQYNIRVITNSWGTTSDAGTDFDPFDPINVATKKLYDRGIVTVFSAGNSGSGTGSTISGNYKKAPWVITVAAGTKDRKLASFSSRGAEGKGGTVEVDGETFTWVDRPTVTAPGNKIISTRTISPTGLLGTTSDLVIAPAHLPFYTTLSGTSMAAPHVAGVVALMLEVNPKLSPAEVKQIIQETAVPFGEYKDWEVGAGYVDAYGSVEKAFSLRD